MFGVLHSLRKSHVARRTAVLTATGLLSRLVNFAVLLFAARMLSKDDMGLFSRCLAIMVFTGGVCELGVNNTLIRFGSEATAHGGRLGGALRFSALIKAVVAVAVLAPGIALSPMLAERWLGGEEQAWVVSTCLVGGVLINTLALMSGAFLAQRRVWREAALTFSTAVSKALGLALVLALAGAAARWENAAVAMALAPVAALALAAAMLPRGSLLGPALSRGERRSFARFCLAAGLAGSVGLLVLHAPVFLLDDEATAAEYYTAFKLALPVYAFIGAFYNVTLERVSSAVHPIDARRVLRRSVAYLAAPSLLLVAAFLFAGPLMALAWSEKYSSAGTAFQGILATAAGQVLEMPLNLYNYYRKRPRVLLVMNVAWLVGAFAFAGLWSPEYGAAGAAWALAAGFFPSRLLGLALTFAWKRGRKEVGFEA